MSVEVYSGKEGEVAHQKLISDLALSYMVVFGNSDLKEGGVSKTGERILLSDYLGILAFVMGLDNLPMDSQRQLKILGELEKVGSEVRTNLFTKVSEMSGFRPYYVVDDVIKRFQSDIAESATTKPIISYWSDEQYPVCGFATGVVTTELDSLTRLLNQMPYLSAFDGDLGVVSRELMGEGGATFPILLDHEAGVIKEKAGSANGSLWREVLLNQRLQGKNLDAQHTLTVTYPGSKYYRSSKSRGEFLVEKIFMVGGDEFVMVIVDLDKAIDNLG